MKKILLIAIILCSLSSKAQVTLGMSQFGPFNYRDTVTAGSSDTFNVWVKNYGPDIFNDQLFVTMAVRDSASSPTDTISSTGSFTPVVINPGDSAFITLNPIYNVGPVSFRYGIDVIVVWPVAASATITDTLEFIVYIDLPESINELDIKDIIKLYPNPTTDNITIENTENTVVETINIYDLSGKAVLSNKGKSVINVEDLAPGIYHADVRLSNKKHYSIKFIRQKNNAE